MTNGGQTPSKCINDGEDLSFFRCSTAYRDIKFWLHQLNRACFPTKSEDGSISTCTLDSPPAFPESVTKLRSMLRYFTELIGQAPPHTGPRRFGNVAFRTWYQLAETKTPELLLTYLPSSTQARKDELSAYLLGSFGSAQRLDYGTGHELSFLAFLGILSKLEVFPPGSERAIVVGVIDPYLELIRTLILSYTLEPAGSHGVWGLDDHSFLPYIFGSAQLGPPIESLTAPTPLQGSLQNAPEPDTITSKPTVTEYSKSNLYFAAVQFIYDVKKGPFWEHSPILFNISGIKDGWGKINKGMLKMYDAEVLGKFPVVQHFPFGKFFAWERDPKAVQTSGQSVHAAQQPSANGAGGSGMGSGVGTQAPWAKPGGGLAATGMPSTRAPWVSESGRGSSAAAANYTPWASAPSSRTPQSTLTTRGLGPASGSYGRAPPSDTPMTAVPSKRKDG